MGDHGLLEDLDALAGDRGNRDEWQPLLLGPSGGRTCLTCRTCRTEIYLALHDDGGDRTLFHHFGELVFPLAWRSARFDDQGGEVGLLQDSEGLLDSKLAQRADVVNSGGVSDHYRADGRISIAFVTGSVVVPGTSETMATFCPMRALIRDDFPEFRRPNMEICSLSPDGVWFRLMPQ